MQRKTLAILGVLPTVSLLLVTGCSTASNTFSTKASQAGFQTQAIIGTRFTHTLYKNRQKNKGVLHVYLGGDGTPWFKGRYITRDPTPLKPIMLALMKMDTTASIYLGRPCYHQRNMPKNCDNSLWTHKRYSPAIVMSMVAALKRYRQQQHITHINLFGFSGGGALAMLIAPHLAETKTVITLAGNLDTTAWTSYHNYAPLIGSLNPATARPLPAHIQQLHIVGGKDKNIPEQLIKPVVQRQPNAKLIRLKQADHHCCWKAYWPNVLGIYLSNPNR